MDATHQQPQPQQHNTTTPSYEVAPTSLSSRPTLGFPLGTALLLVVIFCLSGVLSCCYHWDKIQALRRRALGRDGGEPGDEESGGINSDDGGVSAGIPPPPSKPSLVDQYAKQELNESLPVIMPGDRIPKFIAWPCPCDLPCLVAPPPSSDVPPPDQPEKLATVDERSSSAPPPPPPPTAAVSCATTHTASGLSQEPTLSLNGVV